MKPELFFVPYGEKEILYAPLKRFIAEVNSSARDAAARRLLGIPMSDAQQGFIESLDKHGIFDDAAPPQIDSTFAPTRVTLFPSDRCNLRCRYCYASAEKGGHRLPVPVARAAIDLIIKNAKSKGLNSFSVGFHGNGEPFSAFGVIAECCDYISFAAEQNQMKYAVSTATNGVMSEECLDYMLAWITDVNVSSDILPDIQNSQRPLADGGASFEYADHTLKRLNAAGVQFGIRATITDESVHRLHEMAEFVKEHYPKCRLLHFEPVYEVGRALKTGQTTPDPKTFVHEFLKARAALENSGIRLVFSGERADTLCCCFCSVCNNGFTVTAEGNVTSCYEICTYQDIRAERFVYGKYDDETEQFIFDADIMANLANLHVSNIPYCRDCFCKWHCGGDCLAKTLGVKSPEEHAGSERCVITRALIYRQILIKMGVDVTQLEPVFL